MKTRTLLFLLPAALLLASCGNKGPLVHPSAPEEVSAPAVDDAADDSAPVEDATPPETPTTPAPDSDG